ncbi:MAG: Gfo/Idh/MocA family oxidoreductase [Clostridiales bacterium]|nr:Gfo/Idh/MocA family oxidoreductase [Clostridiales bacterium]
MKTIRIGIYGLWRGASFLGILGGFDGVEVTALCDKNEDKLKAALERCPGAKGCRDYEELLDSGIDGVFLCNYFHEHAKCAVEAMERGIAVFSECTSAPTLAECVTLVETAERTGTKYMIAENYPFSAALLEMKRLVDEGTLGRILYAEGEYNHTCPREELAYLTPGKYHWRAWLPRTYYVTHTLGPLMHVTGQMPVKVNAFAVHSDVLEQYDDFRHNYDAFAMMNCITDGGSLFRFTGCAAMGSPSGYRFVGENGSCETGRTLGSQVNVTYHHWLVPEGRQASSTYAPAWPANAELAERAGHGGGDFWTVYNFIEYLRGGPEPFFNVYRGALMSAVGILAWRSCMEDGKTIALPDFTKKSDRDAVRDDVLTPFPDENGRVSLPCATGKAVNGR